MRMHAFIQCTYSFVLTKYKQNNVQHLEIYSINENHCMYHLFILESLRLFQRSRTVKLGIC